MTCPVASQWNGSENHALSCRKSVHY